jgi:hypothetical protein
MMSKSFELSLKKGDLAENIIKRKLEEKGWVVYQPVTAGAHCFDMLCIKNKKRVIAIDVKSKARMNKFPATGIDYRHFCQYKTFSENHLVEFWVIFVDEFLKKIYGNTIQELEKQRVESSITYPYMIKTKEGNQIRLWPLSAMISIADLNEKQCEDLIVLNQRKYAYEQRIS